MSVLYDCSIFVIKMFIVTISCVLPVLHKFMLRKTRTGTRAQKGLLLLHYIMVCFMFLECLESLAPLIIPFPLFRDVSPHSIMMWWNAYTTAVSSKRMSLYHCPCRVAQMQRIKQASAHQTSHRLCYGFSPPFTNRNIWQHQDPCLWRMTWHFGFEAQMRVLSSTNVWCGLLPPWRSLQQRSM